MFARLDNVEHANIGWVELMSVMNCQATGCFHRYQY